MTLPKFELDTTRLKGLDDTAKASEIQRQFETWKAALSPSELEYFTAGSDRQIPELIFYALVILLALAAYCSANRSDVDANMTANQGRDCRALLAGNVTDAHVDRCADRD